MSLFNSWLPSRPLRRGYELPLWQRSEDQAAFPPPPITTSMYMPPNSRAGEMSVVHEEEEEGEQGRDESFPIPQSDEMRVLYRQEKVLQRNLQALLDIQGEALLAGGRRATETPTPRSGTERRSSNRSTMPLSPIRSSPSRASDVSPHPTRPQRLSSPSSTSFSSSSSSPPQPPAPSQPLPSSSSLSSLSSTRHRRIPLSSARRGIARAVRDFATLKASQEQLASASVRDSQSVLTHLDQWARKRHGLERAIAAIEGGGSGGGSSSDGADEAGVTAARRIQAMQAEAADVKREMDETEARLAVLRNRHNRLMRDIADVDNSVQARAASYKSSLAMLDDEIRRFLDKPPVQGGGRIGPGPGPGPRGSASVSENLWASVRRGPLSSSRSHNAATATATATAGGRETNFLSLPPSRRTLDMACDFWKDECKSLKKQRRAIRYERTALEEGAIMWKEVVDEVGELERVLKRDMTAMTPDKATEQLTNLLAGMKVTISSVEKTFDIASSKGWKLLVVCIGAELEALKQGRDMLTDALGTVGDPPVTGEAGRNGQDDLLSGEHDPEITSEGIKNATPEVGRKVQSPTNNPPPTARQLLYDSDDGPDPELMVTKQESDTE